MMNDISPAKKRAFKYIGFYVGAILFVISFGLGIVAGRLWIIQDKITDDSGNIDISQVSNINRSINKTDSVEFSQFWEVWDKLKKEYVKGDVKEADMFYGALQGMVMSLQDPYSVYFPPKAATAFTEALSGKMEGIGCEIGIKESQLVVISPLSNSPAEKAGLRPADKIVAVNGTSTLGMDINTAVMLIRGTAGTPVTLTIKRANEEKTRDVKIVRAKIVIPTVTYKLEENNIAYISIMQFNNDTSSEMDKYANEILETPDIKGIVLDLRSNPGGFLTAAVDVAGHWVKKGKVIVSSKGKDKNDEGLNSKGKAKLADYKTIVLVNEGSASASEIVAGALQDYNEAVIVGDTTFGKGSVQDYKMFKDGSALKLTIAEWFTPEGKNINHLGITPDIFIKDDFENQKIGEDKVLDSALEIFTSSSFKW